MPERSWGPDARTTSVGASHVADHQLFVLAATFTLTGCAQKPPEPSLGDVLAVLKTKRFVDLTHAFEPGIPHWPGFPDEKRETLYWYDAGGGTLGKGFFAQQYTHVGQWGTHCDPPAHFVRGKRTIDQIDVKEMLLPLVVIDVHEKAAKDPDYVISMDDVRAWEHQHGSVPEGAFVAMRDDWSSAGRMPRLCGTPMLEGVAHYPGWSLRVLKYLYEVRKITASGHETTDTDPGTATSKDDYSLETYILGTDHYQIELLANLDQVPESGALVVVTFPKPKDGSGFPARVFAPSSAVSRQRLDGAWLSRGCAGGRMAGTEQVPKRLHQPENHAMRRSLPLRLIVLGLCRLGSCPGRHRERAGCCPGNYPNPTLRLCVVWT